jgi:hypothetical protein
MFLLSLCCLIRSSKLLPIAMFLLSLCCLIRSAELVPIANENTIFLNF